MKRKTGFAIGLLWFAFLFAKAQSSIDTVHVVTDSVLGIVDSSVIKNQDYVRFSLNRFETPGEQTTLMQFYEKFDSLVRFHDRQLAVYHFGGSHIQADIYSHIIRTYLQTFSPQMKGPRGWIFPFSAVKTNNPWNYKVDFTGKWTGLRNVVKKEYDKPLGLMGISASTSDSISTMTIYYRPDEVHYQYNKVRVYHNIDSADYEVWIKELPLVEKIVCDHVSGFTEFDLVQPLDTVNLIFERFSSDTSTPFTLYGIELLNDDPGIIYSSIGVNGASFDDYLRCQLLEEQLAQLPPDLVIISVGTNDANADDFSPEKYEYNYSKFAEIVRRVNPECALIFTVPNDNYYKYKYPQKNIELCRDVIFNVAQNFGAAVWNFYDIMGGKGSSQKWYADQLMKKDRIHFTTEGYGIKGDLFYEAFLKWYAEFGYLHEHQTNHD